MSKHALVFRKTKVMLKKLKNETKNNYFCNLNFNQINMP